MRLVLSSILLAPLLLGACDHAERVSGPPPRVAHAPAAHAKKLSADAQRVLLERAAEGLLYTSESDFPFVYFWHPGPGRIDYLHRPSAPAALTADGFRELLEIPADEPVEVVSLDDFFARHIERVDPYDSVAVALVPRYVELRETLRRTLSGTQVFRVGRIAIDCYLVGTDDRGDLVGLTTVAIET